MFVTLKTNPMKKITSKLWLLSLAILFAFAAKAQTTCATAATYTYPINQTVTSYTNSIYWFKVTLDTGTFQIQINNTSGTGKIVSADLFKSNTGCSDTSFIETDSLATGYTSFTVQLYNSTASTTYYLRLHDAGGSTTFNVQSNPSCHIVGQFGYCPGKSIILGAQLYSTTSATTTSTYSWTGGATTQTISVTPSTPTVYTVGCIHGGITYTASVSTFSLTGDACNSCQMVPNGTFESCQYNHNRFNNIYVSGSGCTGYTPTQPVSDPTNWKAPTCGTPDYYNPMEVNPFPYFNVSVPTNRYASNTPAHTGNAYGGFLTLSLVANSREYIQSPLKCALVTGQLYNVSFYTSTASLLATMQSNNIGAYLSTSTSFNNFSTTNYLSGITPQVNATSIINNPGTWTQVAGTMTGAGEQYITLGNFYDDPNTLPYPPVGDAYYFVDDISVTPVSPTITASSCQSGTITLTASGAATSSLTSWTNGVTTYTGNPVSIPSPTVATTYTCTINLSSGCSSCANLTATITVQPATACSGTAPTYTPTSNYTFNSSPGYASSNIQVNNGISYTINSSDLRMAPTVSITVASGGTLTIAGSWIHACNQCSSTSMWQGIVVQPGGTLLVEDLITFLGGIFRVYGNIIENAVQAIHTNSGSTVPSYALTSTIFNNNTQDIYIDANTANLSANQITNCVFTCRNLSNHSVSSTNITAIYNDILAATPLHPSYTNPTDLTIAGARTTHGIYVNTGNVTNPIVVGGNSSSYGANIFDNLDKGIYAYQSNLTAINNNFQNLTGNSTDLKGIGIQCDAGSPSVDAVLIAGNSSTVTTAGEPNTFTNCLAGVYTNHMRQVYINNNTFNNETTATNYTTTATYVTGGYGVAQTNFINGSSAADENLQFANNNVQNCAYGHYLDFTKVYNTAHNSLYFINNVITDAAPNYCTYGLYFAQAHAGANSGVQQDALSITSNTITNVTTNAIFAQSINPTGTKGITGFMQIYNNGELSVKYNSALTSLPSPRVASISLNGCNKVRVTYNSNIRVTNFTLTAVPTAQYHGGIYLNASPNCTINCNTVSNTGEGFVFEGTCTTPSGNWQKNHMDYSKYGLVLRTTGILGNQGNMTYPIDDSWGTSADFTDQTLADGTNPGLGTTSVLYTQATSCTYKPCTNGSCCSGTSYGGTTLITISSGSNTLTCGAAGTGDRLSGNNNQVAGNTAQTQADSDSLYYQNIQNTIGDNTYTYPVYDAETRWGLQYLVSSNLPSLTPAQGYGHAKTLALADAAFAVNDYGTALNLTNSFTAANIIESNWQSVNTVLIKLQNDTLNNSDIITLQNVAQQCPHSGGNIVFTARTLLSSHYHYAMEYPNDCPVNNGNGERTQQTASISKQNANKNLLSLYPNPSTGKLYISNFDATQKNVDIEITDITGKLITKQQSTVNSGLIELNLDVNNGVYFVKVVSINGNSQVQKIIINK